MPGWRLAIILEKPSIFFSKNIGVCRKMKSRICFCGTQCSAAFRFALASLSLAAGLALPPSKSSITISSLPSPFRTCSISCQKSNQNLSIDRLSKLGRLLATCFHWSRNKLPNLRTRDRFNDHKSNPAFQKDTRDMTNFLRLRHKLLKFRILFGDCSVARFVYCSHANFSVSSFVGDGLWCVAL